MNFLILILGGIALVVLIFALLLLVAFAYLQLRLMERIFLPDEVPNIIPNNANSNETADRYTPVEGESGVPLDKFTPDFTKPTKLVFQEDSGGHGVEEIEEGDDY